MNVKLTGGGQGQGLCRNAVDHIKNFDDDPQVPQCVAWVIIIKIFNVINSIPAQASF